jgi:hypothetical protein
MKPFLYVLYFLLIYINLHVKILHYMITSIIHKFSKNSLRALDLRQDGLLTVWCFGVASRHNHTMSLFHLARFIFYLGNKRLSYYHFNINIGHCFYDAILKAMWAFAITWRPSSVNFSHFNLLLWNPSAKWTETWYEASIEGPL